MDSIVTKSNDRCNEETSEEIVLNNLKQISVDKDLEDHRNNYQKLKDHAKEYCNITSIHGIKYLAENRTYIEKVWWIASVVTSLYLCIALIIKSYNKWDTSPVIVTFATKETPNVLIPFPSVTICPETKSLPRKFNYTKYYRMVKEGIALEPEMEKKFGYISLICHRPNLNLTSFKDEYAEDEVLDFIDEVSPNFFEIISECKFMGADENCTDLFFPVITDEGLCYSFNLLDRSQIMADNVIHYKNFHKAPQLSNWTILNGYSRNDPLLTYPKRVLYAGSIFALEGKLTMFEEDLDFDCGSSVQGYLMQLSHPGRMPRVRQQHIKLPLDQALLIAVTPDITTTSSAVKNYNPLKRNCYFPEEKQLKFYKFYSQQNCQIECKTNYTLQKCGCVNFYMPRDNQTKFCTGRKLQCIYDAESELLHSWMDKKLEMLHEGKIVEDICDCPPICTSMYYYVENSQSHWSWKKRYDSANGSKHMSYFQIFFKNSQVITLERNELFGASDFLASLGGLLGLCVGFSLLSLIELVYYLTLRIICNIHLFGVKNWSGRNY